MMVIKDEHKSIIGTLKEDGTFKKWPELNLNRARYNKPATTQVISAEHFVVLPAGFKDWDSLQALKEQYAGVVSANVPALDFATDTFSDAPPAGEFPLEDVSFKRGKR